MSFTRGTLCDKLTLKVSMRVKFLLVLLMLVAVVIVVFSYRDNGRRSHLSYKTSLMRGFRLTHKENNNVKWELTAENATFPESNKEVILKDLTVRIYHDHELALKGGSGVYNLDKKTLIINKPVEIRFEDIDLTTDSLTWDSQGGLLTSDKWIKIKNKNFLIEGTGLTANVKDQKIRILKDVKGIFYH